MLQIDAHSIAKVLFIQIMEIVVVMHTWIGTYIWDLDICRCHPLTQFQSIPQKMFVGPSALIVLVGASNYQGD